MCFILQFWGLESEKWLQTAPALLFRLASSQKLHPQNPARNFWVLLQKEMEMLPCLDWVDLGVPDERWQTFIWTFRTINLNQSEMYSFIWDHPSLSDCRPKLTSAGTVRTACKFCVKHIPVGGSFQSEKCWRSSLKPLARDLEDVRWIPSTGDW